MISVSLVWCYTAVLQLPYTKQCPKIVPSSFLLLLNPITAKKSFVQTGIFRIDFAAMCLFNYLGFHPFRILIKCFLCLCSKWVPLSLTFRVKVQPIFYQIESLKDHKRAYLDNLGVLLSLFSPFALTFLIRN